MYPKPLTLTSILALSFLCFFNISIAQDAKFAEKFQEANRLDEETELNQSFLIWTELATEYPTNANVNYKAGRAYLNSYNLKTAALPFLERAVEIGKIDRNYDPFSPFEKNVPVEVYYYYAKALHLNYKLSEAQENYEKFLQGAPGKHFLYIEAELGMEQVDNAKILTKIPVEFEIENLGPLINTEFNDMAPSVSVDENALFFTSARLRDDSSNYAVSDKTTGYYFDDIYVSYKDRNGAWQRPELLSINTPDHSASLNVSVDGQTLYIYKADGGNGDIYRSKLVGEVWSEPEPMPEPINSSAWETHLTTTADGRTIYFVSDRKGTLGGRDIFQTKLLPNGKWGDAKNLGDAINTIHDEDAVFMAPDGKTLYFSSEGHSSMGGFDVFSTELQENGEWSTPKNIGYPINTVDDDLFFVTSADGKRAYFSSERKEGLGKQDLYMISLPEPKEVKLAVLQGTVVPADGENIPEDLVVIVTNRETGEAQMYTPRKRDGTFVAILPPCFDYEVDYLIGGTTAASDTFSIDCESAYQEIYKQLLLAPVVLGESGAVMVESTGGDAVPADFMRNFGYNENIVSAEEEIFKKFMASVKAISEKNGVAKVEIVGSSSKVPTNTYGSNQELANMRANNGKARILKYAPEFGIDPSKIEFVRVQGLVQGPEYKGDAQAGREKYKKYQYIELIAH